MATTFAVPDGRVAMAATTYTGNATAGTNISNAVNAIGMQPDFVWIKNRSGANDHILTDSVRGATKTLVSNLTNAEVTATGALTAFNTGGFQIGYDGSAIVNATSNNYVGWQWKAGGTAVSNTAGTITSSVSANTTAGFSVSTFTIPASGAFTFGHGLGVVPSMVIVKRRSNASSWGVWHTSLSGGTYYVLLDSTAAQANDSTVFTATPTVSVVNMGSAWATTGAQTMVAYCWAAVPGYSAFGSYTGNGSADGPFIYTGFRPRWIMFKRTDTAGYNWHILDTSRSVSNAETLELYANLSDAETAYYSVLDGVSNGIKVRNADASVNASGGTYIYAAFAENPLRYSNAR
jgi:hypothetical protein